MNHTDEGPVSPAVPISLLFPHNNSATGSFLYVSVSPSSLKELPCFFTAGIPCSLHLSKSQGVEVVLQQPLEAVAISQTTNCAQTMSWHQPHTPPPHIKCSSPSKHHTALPSAPSSSFPAQHSGGQDKNTGVASSLLRHILASFGKHRMQAERKASHRAGQSPHILIKLNITLTARTNIQGVQGILKLPLVLRNSKHHQKHCLKMR